MNLANIFKVPDFKSEDVTLLPSFEDQPHASTSAAVTPELEEITEHISLQEPDELNEDSEELEVEATLVESKGKEASQQEYVVPSPRIH